MVSPTPSKLEETAPVELHDRCRCFLSLFNLKYPIIQAPTDGPATSALAIAVSNAGALGALPLTWVSPDLAYKRVMEL